MAAIVLADPDAERRAADAFALRSSGSTVAEVVSLEAALAAVAESAPRVLVLDATVCSTVAPARLAAALRSQPETADVRLVLLVEVGQDPAVDLTGADVVVQRPATVVDLVRATLR